MSEPEYSFTPAMAIRLKDGQIAIVDADDHPWLSQYQWSATWSKAIQKFYVVRTECLGGKYIKRAMHREIMSPLSRRQVSFINGDTLDNRRCNLWMADVPSVIQPDGYRLIPLTRGQIAKVDIEDYSQVSSLNWIAAWCTGTQSFYAMSGTRLDGKFKNLSMARIILNAPSDKKVDHENHDTLDNRRYNLRLATGFQNVQNHLMHRDNTSGFRGVIWAKDCNKWRARITRHNILIHLGLYNTAEEASAAYEAVAKEYRGEFYLPPDRARR